MTLFISFLFELYTLFSFTNIHGKIENFHLALACFFNYLKYDFFHFFCTEIPRKVVYNLFSCHIINHILFTTVRDGTIANDRFSSCIKIVWLKDTHLTKQKKTALFFHCWSLTQWQYLADLLWNSSQHFFRKCTFHMRNFKRISKADV